MSFLASITAPQAFRAFLGASFIALLLPASPAQANNDRAFQALAGGNSNLARQILAQRGIWGHFNHMDINNDVSLTYPEMERYFFGIHSAFDYDRNGIVTQQEAPQLLLRYTLSGQPFPARGLTQQELRGRLQRLFVTLDKNRNRHLSLLELR